jgi:uncharacterized membrane protein YdjX (TVP38/TMEM64 family)/rhodanese-related sulfurtransferase
VRRGGFFLLFLFLIALASFLLRAHFDAAALRTALGAAGPAAPILFVAAYALASIAFLPGAPFSLAAGFLFGPWWGTLFSLGGALLGATAAFLIARHLAQAWVRERARGILADLLGGIAASGWRFVLWVRLVPLFPFNLLNYALGLTELPLTSYVWASALGMLPGAFLYNWLGYTGRRWSERESGAMRDALIAFALVAVLLLVPALWRRLRRRWHWLEAAELAAWLEQKRPCTLIDVRSAAELKALPPIRGARHVPLERIREQAAALCASSAGTPLVLVCHTARRAALAADLLCSKGAETVFVLRGGMLGWKGGREGSKRRG